MPTAINKGAVQNWTPPANLTNFPIIVRSKKIKIFVSGIPGQNTQFFFDYDQEINDCYIKGIRFEPRQYVSGFTTFFGTIRDDSNGDYTAATLQNAVNGWLLNLVDTKGNAIISDYPVANLGIVTTVVRRYNMQIDLSKSYIHYADPSSITAPYKSVLIFTFYYKPKK